jgi:hypothetical protein
VHKRQASELERDAMATAVYTALSVEDQKLAAGEDDRVPGRPGAVNFKRYIDRKLVSPFRLAIDALRITHPRTVANLPFKAARNKLKKYFILKFSGKDLDVKKRWTRTDRLKDEDWTFLQSLLVNERWVDTEKNHRRYPTLEFFQAHNRTKTGVSVKAKVKRLEDIAAMVKPMKMSTLQQRVTKRLGLRTRKEIVKKTRQKWVCWRFVREFLAKEPGMEFYGVLRSAIAADQGWHSAAEVQLEGRLSRSNRYEEHISALI